MILYALSGANRDTALGARRAPTTYENAKYLVHLTGFFGGLAKFFGFPVNCYDHRHVP